MKPYVRGKSIYFREVMVQDAEFILTLRNDPSKGEFISQTSDDVTTQRQYIDAYQHKTDEHYFIINNWEHTALGTVRIYDIQGDSFCWGSWLIAKEAPLKTAIESALMLYDYAFYGLHYTKCHFDVRKGNKKVIQFHKTYGAQQTHEDDLNYYFHYDRDLHAKTRLKYKNYLP